jgi:hypothetical protein
MVPQSVPFDPTTSNALQNSGAYNPGQGLGPILSAPTQTSQYGANNNTMMYANPDALNGNG